MLMIYEEFPNVIFRYDSTCDVSVFHQKNASSAKNSKNPFDLWGILLYYIMMTVNIE